MKKSVLILLLATILPVCLMAHAPKKVDLSFDAESSKLTVELPHKVKKVDSHFIESIKIEVNGEEFKVLEYEKQSSLEAHSVEVEIPSAKKGDKISVSAKCNKMGAKSATLTVE
ncbi:MAG: hypothetical protein MI922_28315 [Bacteroidales bacterium]|nr:hypothetical protein [Bacteroidales bacterium]